MLRQTVAAPVFGNVACYRIGGTPMAIPVIRDNRLPINAGKTGIVTAPVASAARGKAAAIH